MPTRDRKTRRATPLATSDHATAVLTGELSFLNSGISMVASGKLRQFICLA
jgi:hypothetical protein